MLYLGGNFVGTRLAIPFLDLVPLTDLAATLRIVLTLFHDTREPGEAFGEFVERVGLDTLREPVQALFPKLKGPKVNVTERISP